MRNRFIGVLAVAAATLMSACGGVAPPTMNPLAFVHAAAARTAAVRTYKTDMIMTMSGKISLAANQCTPTGELPASMAAALAASSQGRPIAPQVKAQMCAQLALQASQPPMPYSMKMTASGRFRAPSDYAASTTMSIGGLSTGTSPTEVSMQMVHIGSATYITDPRTHAWTTVDKLGVGLDPSLFDSMNFGAYSSFLDAAKSVKDLGDTTLKGTRVHHYQIVVDPEYLIQQSAKKPMFKDPALQKQILQYAESLRNSPTTVEAWVGIDDQLLHREVMDIVPGAGSTAAGPSPITDLKQHFEIDLHDFNAKVDIAAPAVS